MKFSFNKIFSKESLLATSLLMLTHNAVAVTNENPYLKAQGLVDSCSVFTLNSIDNFQSGFCAGTITSTLHSVQLLNSNEQLKVCLPPSGTDTMSVAKDFVEFVKANPQFATQNATYTAIIMLSNRYPCEE